MISRWGRLAGTFWLCCSGLTPAAADSIDHYLQAQMAKEHIPGLAIAMVRNGRILKLKSYGLANLEWDIAATTDTAYQLASATKLLTATALMRVVEAGKIALDDPITRYLPEAPSAWGAITIRHLTTHTSGLKDLLALPKLPGSLDEAIQTAFHLPLQHPPGETTVYASSDYCVLMRLIERVTGKSFPTFMRDELFTPLGMTASGFDGAVESGLIRKSELVRHRTSIYDWQGGAQKNQAFLFPNWTYPAGGLYSSAADLARWAAALDEGKLLKPETLRQMWTPARLNDGQTGPFGIGWIVAEHQGRKVVGHSGGPALADVVRFVDDRLTIAVLTNQQHLMPYLAMGVADLYYAGSKQGEQKPGPGIARPSAESGTTR
jgi:CubicO group peptidase (beta-lactamase class C family)